MDIIKKYKILIFFFLTVIVSIGTLFVGNGDFEYSRIFEESAEYTIFWNIRVPRLLLAFFSGGVLSVSGMVFQAIFRNPIASPFTLGIASGASFGATLYITLGFPLVVYNFPVIVISAFFGALISVFIIYSISLLYKNFDSQIMILTGIVISFFFTSIIMFSQYVTDYTNTFKITRWTMGGLDIVGYDGLLVIVIFSLLGFIAILYYVNDLNLISIDEELSISRGVNVTRVKKILFLTTSLMIGAVVSITGPIAFVGIIGPHIARRIVGNEHKSLSVVSVLTGALLLIICDSISRMIMWPVELPVGIVTSIVGGFFFIWVVIAQGRRK